MKSKSIKHRSRQMTFDVGTGSQVEITNTNLVDFRARLLNAKLEGHGETALHALRELRGELAAVLRDIDKRVEIAEAAWRSFARGLRVKP